MEKFTPLATNFTLPPGLTGWTNFTSGRRTAQGGGWGIERYQNFLTKAAVEHLVANFGYRDLK